MRVLIFATHAEFEIIENDSTSDSKDVSFKLGKQTNNTNNVKIAENDCILDFNYIEDFKKEGNLQKAINSLTTIWNKYQNEEKRIFIHTGHAYQDVKNNLKEIPVESIAFYSRVREGEVVWNKLKEIKAICQGGKLSEGKQKEFETLFNEIWDLHTKKKIEEVIKYLILLKHRIAHLFLPMDIDLQGIAEVKELEEKGEKTEGTAIEYLKEVLEEKRNNPKYYRQKLADLQWMVAKVELGDLKPTENLLKGTNAIIDLIDVKKRGDEDLKKYWERLLILCGLLPSNNELFNSEKIKLNSASPILKFMQSLDERVENQNAKEIDKILKFDDLETMLENNSAPTDSKVSFHKWFCALDACLEKLREEIKDKGNRS